MKKLIGFVVMLMAGVAMSAQLTLDNQDATKTGLPGMATKINTMMTEIYNQIPTNGYDRLMLCVTNASIAVQSKSITYQGVDGSTNTISVCTNVVLTITR